MPSLSRLLVASVPAAVLALGTATPAQAVSPVTCSISSTTLTVTLNVQEFMLGLRKNGAGDVEVIFDPAGMSFQACATAAAYAPVTTVQVNDPGGLTGEFLVQTADFVSDTVNLGIHAFDSAWLVGSSGPDSWQAPGGVLTVSGSGATVTLANQPGSLRVEGLAGNDVVDLHDWPGDTTIEGGAGDDVLHGGAAHDEIYPQDGKDTVDTGAGDDRLIGQGTVGDGDADTFTGSGNDLLDLYNDAPARVDLGPTSGGDGVAGENDDYSGFTQVRSGPGGATVYAGSAGVFFTGNAGPLGQPDKLVSGPGDDFFQAVEQPGEISYERTSTPVHLTYDDPSGSATGDGTDYFTRLGVITGGSAGDDLDLSAPDMVIRPGLGNDHVTTGPDSLVVAGPGADGADTVSGATGAGGHSCTMDYGARTAPLSVTLYPADEADDGTAGEGDRVACTDVIGGSQADVLVGGPAAETLDGRGGDDQLVGRGGGDTLLGGTGADTLTGGSGADTITAGDGADTLLGGTDDDTLAGQAGADRLDGGSGDDTERGGTDADTFLQGAAGTDNGSDLLAGDAGSDTASYLGRSAGISASNNGSWDDGLPGEADRVGTDVERLVGTAYADVLKGAGLADTLDGQGGNDTLTGGAGNDTLSGGAGDDTFVEGSPTQNGKDVLNGEAGTDTVTYLGRGTGVTVSKDNLANDGTGAEADNVRTDVEKVIGTSFVDTLTGGAGPDWLYGRGGNDVLKGLGGADALFGEDGNDTFYAKDGVKDTLNGGAGTDRSNHDAVDVRTLVEQTF